MTDEEIKPLEAGFSQRDLSQITYLANPTIDNWIRSGALKRTKFKPAPFNPRHFPRVFTFETVLQAAIIRRLVKLGGMKPTEASLLAEMAASAAISGAVNESADKRRDRLHLYVWTDGDRPRWSYEPPNVPAISLPASKLHDETYARAVEVLTPQIGAQVPE